MTGSPSQHYVFAHRALPSVIFRDKVWALSVLNGRDADRFVHDLWEQVGESLPAEARSEPAGLAVRAAGTGNGLIVFVEMPPPQELTEAHTIVIAAKCAEADPPTLDDLEYVRYFAVERGVDLTTDEPIRVLGEWRESGVHANHGPLTAHDETGIVQAVANVIRGEQGN
jgi:hypothetical protein